MALELIQEHANSERKWSMTLRIEPNNFGRSLKNLSMSICETDEWHRQAMGEETYWLSHAE